MNKVHTFDINDEPFVNVSTGKRQATLIYKGPRYVYAELDIELKRIQAPVHASEEPELEIAEERLTQEPTRKIICIDADENPIAAAIIWGTSSYTLEIPKYVEELSDGTEYVYDYGEDPSLDDIFDLKNMDFNFEENDFEYTYDINDVSDEDFIQSVDYILEHIAIQLKENSYSPSQLTEINDFKAKVTAIKENYDGSIKHWKFEFPTCSVL